MRPRLLDLFCGAGGAAMGYHRAGFEVVGVDIEPQPNYPFRFIQGDALHWVDSEWAWTFDAIHASPPCQAYTATTGNMTNSRTDHPDLIPRVRELLTATALPWVIENVVGAPLRDPHQLCGSSFNLGVDYRGPSGPEGWLQLRRHRLFEVSFSMMDVACQFHSRPTLGLYGDHASYNRRRYGSGKGQFSDREKVGLAQRGLGIDWTDNWDELREAIPPAYTEHIGHYLMEEVKRIEAGVAA